MIPTTGHVDEQAARELVQSLGEQADTHGFGSLGIHQRVILLAWAGRGIIGNGGFRYWYEGKGEEETCDLAAAFRLLGCEAVAGACEQSIGVFPAGIPRDANTRRDLLGSLNWKGLRDSERVVFRLKFPELMQRIARYIEANRKAFLP